MADYQIKITAVDNATPIVDKAFKNTQKSATDVSGKIGQRFRDVFENVTQNATGAFGSVAGGLFKLPGPAGIAAAAILAIGGAAVASAKKYAEANAANDTASAQFLANLEGLKRGFGDVVNSVGASVIPIFNRLADVFGFAGTKADQLEKARAALFSGLKSQRDEIDTLISNLTLQRESQGAFKPVIDAANRIKTLTAERNQILNAIGEKEKTSESTANTLKNLFVFRRAAEQTSLATQQTRVIEIEKELSAAQELLLIEKQRFDARGKVTKEIQAEKQVELEVNAKVASSIVQQLNNERQRALLLPTLFNLQLQIAGAMTSQQGTSTIILSELQRQEVAVSRVGQAIQNGIVNALENAIFAAKDLNGFIENILQSFLRAGIGFALNALTGGIGGALGGIFGSSAKLASGNTPIPVSGRPAPAAAVATPTRAQAGSAISLNFTSPVIDINFVRNRLVPMLRELNRNGISIA